MLSRTVAAPALMIGLCLTMRLVDGRPTETAQSLLADSGPNPLEDTGIASTEEQRNRRQLNIIQTKLIDLLQPQPIVDTMKKEERYGNKVDHKIGRTVVRTVESLSNFINSAFSFPVNTAKKISRGATEALNQVGAKLVGLQK